MAMQLKDKVIWITGASSGIGKALAFQLSEHGAKLILSSRRAEELEKVKHSLAVKDVVCLPLDLEKSHSFPEIAKTAADYFGGIDILINCAGLGLRGIALETLPELERKIMEINFFGTVNLTRAVLPYLMKKKEGAIVTISSMLGKYAFPEHSIYAASKHALNGYFDALANEVSKDNVHVMMVNPGFIKTDVTVNMLNADGTKFGKMSPAQSKGMSPETCAIKIIKALKNKKREIFPGGPEVLSVNFKNLFPDLFYKLVRLKLQPK
jgi:dehydrogenase/reductase SDR family member 7B